MRATVSNTAANRENPKTQTPRPGLTTAPHSFVALWGHFAVRHHGQTQIPKVAQFYSGQTQPSGALLLRRLVRFCSGVDTRESDIGWVSTAYLAAMGSLPEPMPDATPNIGLDGGPLPGVFSVSGITAGDRLWVRDAPHAGGHQIGSLHPGSVINVDGRASGNWGQVTHNGQIGYINMRFLTRMAENASSTTANGFPLGLSCRGTEPFWTLEIGNDRQFQYTALVGGPDPARWLAMATPAPSGGYPFTFKAHPMTGIINQETCSDGMSDTLYHMSIQLNRPSGNNGHSERLFGCCNMQ